MNRSNLPKPILTRGPVGALRYAWLRAPPSCCAKPDLDLSEVLTHKSPYEALGPSFATTLTSELFYKDFDNRRQVAAYCGLPPSPWRSGGIDREQGISKAGNPRARLKAIELAWLWLRHQPESELSRWFNTRTAEAGKRARRIAIVALARKLMVALWRYLTTGLVPAGATMKA